MISATIARGNEFKLLRRAKAGEVTIVLSPQILKEFKEVISRSKFGFSEEQIINAIKQIMSICILVMPTISLDVIPEDPDDNSILECAVTGGVDYVISGDEHLLKLKDYNKIKIIRTYEIFKVLEQL